MTVFLTEQILFVHVPKTAGTTVRHFIESHFAEEAIFPPMEAVHRDPFLYREIEHARPYSKQIRQAPLVRCHIPYHHIAPLLAAQPVTLTMLRNPIRRALSEIFHLRRDGDYYLREMSLEAMIDLHPDAYRPGWSYFGSSAQEAIQAVIRFDWLGIQEMFDVSMNMLCETMGWAAPAAWEYENTMPAAQQAIPVSMEALDMLNERLYDDMRFYTAAREHFMERLRQPATLPGSVPALLQRA